MPTYRLTLTDGNPADPPTFRTAATTWRVGDTFLLRPGKVLRILEMRDSGGDVNGEWVVEDAY